MWSCLQPEERVADAPEGQTHAREASPMSLLLTGVHTERQPKDAREARTPLRDGGEHAAGHVGRGVHARL